MQFHGPIELSVQRADKYIEIPLERAETTTTATSKISNQVNAPADDKESKISSGSSLNGKPKPNVPPKIVNKKPPTRQVTETDLYLLGAIEKLVYRVDFMEKRLRRVEEMMYFMMAGNRIDEGMHISHHSLLYKKYIQTFLRIAKIYSYSHGKTH